MITWRERFRPPWGQNPWARLAFILSIMVLLAGGSITLAPYFANTLYGFHDWDASLAYRYITPIALKRFHQMPWWNPYLCGGFPAWGYAEGSSSLVSPFLPAYLAFPIQIAGRIEASVMLFVSLATSYLLASRFSRSFALCALVAVLYTLNSRWALQAGAGHMWHLHYGWLPLVLYWLDRSFEPQQIRKAVYAGALLALIVYMGGIYPVPHGALAVALYAMVTAWVQRSLRPLISGVVVAACAVGFAAPKLLAIADTMQRFSRAIGSAESHSFWQLLGMLTASETGKFLDVGSLGVHDYGWHEYGLFLGPAALLVIIGIIWPITSRRIEPLRASAIVFTALALGSFATYAPWALLHRFPFFSSLHVPSRFLLVAVLFASLSFAAMIEARFGVAIATRRFVDPMLVVIVGAVAAIMATVSYPISKGVFFMHAPQTHWSGEFQQLARPPGDYQPPGAWAGAILVSMNSNRGFVQCASVPDNAEPRGAIATTDAKYKGEAYVVGGTGSARILRWSPNEVEIQVENAQPEAILVYNMNFDPSWRQGGKPALEHEHAVATRIQSANQRVVFSYFPRTLPKGIAIFLTTLLLVCFSARIKRQIARWLAPKTA